jgi:predicted amidohydrolase YtcJ
MILTNGRIYTMDAAVPRLSALPVTRDGRVARGVEAWEGESSAVSNERIDLGGRTVLPGLCDAHLHFRSWAMQEAELDLSPCPTLAAAIDAIGRSTDPFVIARGLRPALLAGGERPRAAALDGAAAGRPVAVWAHDRHTLWLSTSALTLPGAAAHDDGELRERDAWAVELPEPDAASLREIVDGAQRRAHAAGVTAVHDFEGAPGFAIWQELHASRRQTLRVVAAQETTDLAAVRATGLATGFGDDLLQVGPMKAFLDGTLGSRTASLLTPLADGSTGMVLTTREELVEIVRDATAGRLQVAVHAIGDRANRDALDAFAATRALWHGRVPPPRIEHAQLVHPDDVARFAAIGVTASMQPTHATSDRDVADDLWGATASLPYAWRALLDAGATLAFGSDAPIEPLAPLAAIHAAVNRTLDERPAWERVRPLSVHEAIAASTTGPAAAAGLARLGRLAPGFAADLVVLDDDPFTCPPERIATIGVVATMVAGRWVHGRPPW